MDPGSGAGMEGMDPGSGAGMEGMDPGSGAGMTGEGGGWRWVTMKRWHYKAAPPARPFESAQGERPHAALGWISAYAG